MTENRHFQSVKQLLQGYKKFGTDSDCVLKADRQFFSYQILVGAIFKREVREKAGQ